MTEKDKLATVVIEKINELLCPLESEGHSPIHWCKEKFPNIYGKIMNNDEIDDKWDFVSDIKFKNLLKQKYNQVLYVVNLYQKRREK